MEYQHFLVEGFKPFDPLELARRTEAIVTRRGPTVLRGNILISTQFLFIGVLLPVMLLAVVYDTSIVGVTGQETSLKFLGNSTPQEMRLKNF
ncbi:MAG: hypothetical protein QXP91_06845 [Candidatus Methanomethylicia archaeon]